MDSGDRLLSFCSSGLISIGGLSNPNSQLKLKRILLLCLASTNVEHLITSDFKAHNVFHDQTKYRDVTYLQIISHMALTKIDPEILHQYHDFNVEPFLK